MSGSGGCRFNESLVLTLTYAASENMAVVNVFILAPTTGAPTLPSWAEATPAEENTTALAA